MNRAESQALEALAETTDFDAKTLAYMAGLVGGDWREAIERVIWYFHALRSIETYLEAYENGEVEPFTK